MHEDYMNNPSWIVLLPPVLVVIITIATKRINIAFVVSLITAAFIATKGTWHSSFQLIAHRTMDQIKDPDYIYLSIFLLTIGIFITLFEKTGGILAFTRACTQHIRSKKSAETTSLLVSATLFVDDYLSNLTVGYVMSPITDTFRIPRAKLAYLVHSVSIPLIMIMPLSSWIAMITGQLGNAGIAMLHEAQQNPVSNLKIIADPFILFLDTIPFIFYSFFALLSVLIVVRHRISYGPMRTLEHIASTTDDVFGQASGHPSRTMPPSQHKKHYANSPSLIDFFLPLCILIVTFITMILYTGGYHIFGGPNTLVNAFKNTNKTFLSICIAGCMCLASAIVLAVPRRKIALHDLHKIFLAGIRMMLPAVIMLILATTLSTVVYQDLRTGTYLAALLENTLAPSLIPCMFFVVAAATAFLMGTSWGTVALLLPMAIPIMITCANVSLPTTPSLIPLLFPGLGAIFSGAACGDHLSPISQTTLMAATSTGIDPITHAQTQIPYNIPAFVATTCAYVISGICVVHHIPYTSTLALSSLSGLIINIALLATINNIIYAKRTTQQN
jgi:Na+/H+ antiporter NhaC